MLAPRTRGSEAMVEVVELLRTVLAEHYAVDRELGRGGMATVYLARDLKHGRLVAVKVLRPTLAESLGPGRFLREIRIASRLTHPNILPLHESGEAEGLLFYVMPYVAGESLRDRLRREGQLPVGDAIRIAQEVAHGLAYAHAEDVVHRDVKPGNILLEAGHAVIADFGLARAIHASALDDLSSAGLAVGTPAYMSPEQAGGGDQVDGRSDVYSLGCVLYEMLAGEPPFTGNSAQAIAAKHLQLSPPPLRTVRPSVPESVEATINRALEKVPGDRFQTAEEFGQALAEPGYPAAGRKPGRSTPGRLLAGGFIGAVLVIFLAMAIPRRAHVSSTSQIGLVLIPFENGSPPADSLGTGRPALHTVLADALAWLPGVRPLDGSMLLGSAQGWHMVPLPELLRGARRIGGRYLLTGAIYPVSAASGSRVTVDLYAVNSGERLMRAEEIAEPGRLEASLAKLALESVRALAPREGLALGSRAALFSATSSAAALGHLLQAQAKFWTGDLDDAVGELRAAVEADSNCGLAYQRLSVVQAWRHDYPAALAAADSGLARADRMNPRWVQLLNAQRYLVLGYGDSAIAAYQSVVLDDRDDIDGWLGLGEALVHYAGFSGASTLDARPALERVATIDSAFAPIYDHLVDLAVYAGDASAANIFLGRMRADRPLRAGKAAEVRLRFGTPGERAEALAALRKADRQVISEAVISWAHGAFDLRLADTAASFLLGKDRVPDDRRRGAQYRLVTQAALGRWAQGYAAWDSVAGTAPFDPWLIQADLAGYPTQDRAAPMYEWARVQMRTGRTPDFTLPPWDERRQGFEALVYRAAVAGDSAETRALLDRIDRAPPVDPAEPGPGALRASLQARLALLAHDTAAAVDALQRAVARIPEVYTANHPFTAVAPQRLLLARLLLARGDSVGAKRWRRSFAGSWSVADQFYLARLDSLGAGWPPPRLRSAP